MCGEISALLSESVDIENLSENVNEENKVNIFKQFLKNAIDFYLDASMHDPRAHWRCDKNFKVCAENQTTKMVIVFL